MKKGSSSLIASIMAASTVAFTSSGDTDVSAVYTCSKNEVSSSSSSSSIRNDGRANNNSSGRSSLSSSLSSSTSMEKEKFAPRFDGLRFIETLVTAHR